MNTISNPPLESIMQDSAKIIAKLEANARAIINGAMRGQRTTNMRMSDRLRRYEYLREDLLATTEGHAVWVAYCTKNGWSTEHNARDLMA